MANWFPARKQQPQAQVSSAEPVQITLDEAVKFVQEEMLNVPDEQELYSRQKTLNMAMAGDSGSAAEAIGLIESFLEGRKIVRGLTNTEAAREIYSRVWGLGVVEKYYRDPAVDEIRVNGPDKIFIQRRGKNERVSDRFQNEEEVERVIKRMILEDTGIYLDRSSPIIESVRKDGTRLTATCYPVTSTWTFVIRKHGTFEMSLENLEKAKTLDRPAWQALSVLAKGRANFLFSGNVGAGKTSLMRKLIGELHPNLRLLVIGKDLELLLAKQYPGRDIIEMEEHAHVGATMKDLFVTALRESPDAVIIEEFRGAGEAIEAVRACTRGLPGSMATAHFNTPEEVVEGTAMLMLEEGLHLPIELAKLRVARAFNIIVQMYGDTVRGVKKLVSITEIYVDEKGEICYQDLVRWSPADEYDYLGEGAWEFKNRPSPRLLAQLKKSVSEQELRQLGWLAGTGGEG